MDIGGEFQLFDDILIHWHVVWWFSVEYLLFYRSTCWCKVNDPHKETSFQQWFGEAFSAFIVPLPPIGIVVSKLAGAAGDEQRRRDQQMRLSAKKSIWWYLILLMEEILYHLRCIKPCKQWDKLPINWCRISSINGMIEFPIEYHHIVNIHPFFPERRFVAGFFRRLLAYLTPHISHTYLTPHISQTYLTPHISHTWSSHHTYPTHIHHTTHIPHISIQNVSHQYVSPPIRIRSTRIPPIRIHAMRIHSMRNPFKRCASAGIANVSHQYISHQYVSSTRIPPVRVHSMRIHSKSLHQQEWQWVWVSLHIISYHCYSARMVMNIETLLFLQFFAKLLIEYNCIARAYEHEIHC